MTMFSTKMREEMKGVCTVEGREVLQDDMGAVTEECHSRRKCAQDTGVLRTAHHPILCHHAIFLV
jgi:hypothetical protein